MSGPYNGFSPQQRKAGGNVARAALAAGELPRPTRCEACGSTTKVQPHNENYDTPLDFYDVCYVCHMMIHCRYRAVARWTAYLKGLRAGAVYEPVTDWITFRGRYLQNGDLSDRIVDHGPPRPRSFLHALPLEPTGKVPPKLPRPARLR